MKKQYIEYYYIFQLLVKNEINYKSMNNFTIIIMISFKQVIFYLLISSKYFHHFHMKLHF